MSLAWPCLLRLETLLLQTWMRRESDLVQALAQAYAEREVLEASIRAAAEVSQPCHMQLVCRRPSWPDPKSLPGSPILDPHPYCSSTEHVTRDDAGDDDHSIHAPCLITLCFPEDS